MFDRISGRTRRDRANSTTSTLISLGVHASLVAALVWAASSESIDLFVQGTDTGIDFGELGGGGGGGGGSEGELVTYVDIAEPAGAEEAAEEEAVPTPSEPEPEPEPEPPEPVREAPEVIEAPPAPRSPPRVIGEPATGSTGTGGGVGGGQGTGTGEGRGSGVGPGEGSGTGGGSGSGVGTGTGSGTGRGDGTAPVPEFLLVPPEAPDDLRGRTLIVRLAIDRRGRVTGVELRPSTGDRGYDRRLERQARDWRFRPARDPSGNAIASSYDFEVVL